MAAKRTTRRQVAERAGTSEAVVSYVVNHGPRPVAVETRQRVERAIRELDYRVSHVARSLRTASTQTLGLIVPDASNPFYAALASAVEQEAFSKGYGVFVGNSRDELAREQMYARALVDRQADGIILVPCSKESMRTVALADEVTCVTLDRPLEDEAAFQFFTDHEGGAYAATRHLLDEHGRKRIGCVAGPKKAYSTEARVRGWRRALHEAGIDASAVPISYSSFGQRDGYEQGRALLPAGVDAAFVTSDQQAKGVLRAAHELGIAIPEDVAVFAFDGIADAAFCVPSLSTVAQPIYQMAALAVSRATTPKETLVASELSRAPVEFAYELLLRESCGCGSAPAG